MKGNLFFFLFSLSVLFVLAGCYQTPKDSSNTLKITQVDEKIIQEYLDTKTNDISAPYQGGKMYSAFKIFGTDTNKIYAWMLKYEYLKETDEFTNGVSIPIVLYIKSKDDKIMIKNHKYPKDGEEYGKSMEKLFPQNVRNNMNKHLNECVEQLEEVIKTRIREENKKG